jgi:hypothetical protein
MEPKNGKAAVIGGGPSDLSCAPVADYDGRDGGQERKQSGNGSNGQQPPRQIVDGVFFSKQTTDMLLKVPKKLRSDAMALLWFYHYTALWQGTDQPKATLSYVLQGLGWHSRNKVCAVRKVLLDLGLIEKVRAVDPRTGKVVGHYVKVRFFQPMQKTTVSENDTMEKRYTNALRSGNGNASRSGNKFKTSLNSVLSKAAHSPNLADASLEDYSEQEREVIAAYHRIVCDNDRSWRVVNRHTERVCHAIDLIFAYADGEDGDVETFFRNVVAASRCGCENKKCKACRAVRIPRRGQSRTLVSVAWKNY